MKFTFTNISDKITLDNTKDILEDKIVNASPRLVVSPQKSVDNYFDSNSLKDTQIQIPIYDKSEFVTLMPGKSITIVANTLASQAYYNGIVVAFSNDSNDYIECKIEDDPSSDTWGSLADSTWESLLKYTWGEIMVSE